jgi:hypothetical protein
MMHVMSKPMECPESGQQEDRPGMRVGSLVPKGWSATVVMALGEMQSFTDPRLCSFASLVELEGNGYFINSLLSGDVAQAVAFLRIGSSHLAI